MDLVEGLKKWFDKRKESKALYNAKNEKRLAVARKANKKRMQDVVKGVNKLVDKQFTPK